MNDDIKKAINKIALFLKELDFKKKALTWHKKKKEFILLIDLQRSAWSPEYYVNVGIILDNDNELSLKTHNSDIRYRVSCLNKQNEYRDIYKIEDDFDSIIQLIQNQVIDVFDNMENIEEVKAKILTDGEEEYLLTLKAKEKFHIKE